MIFQSSLAARLNFLLTLCIAGMVIVTSVIDYQLSRQVILRQVADETQAVISDTLADLETHISGIERATELFASILTQRNYSEEEIISLLQVVLRGRNDIFGATVALDPRLATSSEGFAPYFHHGEHGELVYVDLASNDAYYPNQPWFREPRGREKPVWSEPYFDEGGGRILMSTYSVPMFAFRDGKREFLGVVTADLALAELNGQLGSFQLGESGFALLLSRHSKILAGPDGMELMEPLVNTLPTDQDLQQWSKLVVMAGRGEGSTARMPCMNQQGMCVLKMSPLPSTGWPLGAYYSEYEMLAPLRGLLIRMAISELASLVLILVAVAVVSRRITRPLTALVSVTDNVAAGRLDAPMPRAENQDEVGRLISSFGSMQKNLKHHIEQLEQETASRNRLQGELNAATEIQLSMLPNGGKTHLQESQFSLWAAQRPAKSVGGDLYAYHFRSPDELLFAVGDVSDKGVPAALFMARAMTLLQLLADTDLLPHQLLAQLNDDLASGNDNCMFVTLFCGILRLDSLRLDFSSAGHTPPSLLRGDSCTSIEQESGPALALAEELEFPPNQIQLQAGDLLAIFTDGIDEAFNDKAEQFGVDGFNSFLSGAAHADLEQLGSAAYQAIDRHAGGTPQSDDITLMLVALPAAADTRAQKTDSASWRNEPGVVSSFLAWLKSRLAIHACPADIESELLLVAEEVLTNILKYAEMPADGKIQVELQTPEGGIELRFSDPGKAFDPLKEAEQSTLGLDSDAAAIGGLGVHLLTTLTDSQEYRREEGRNFLRLYRSCAVLSTKGGSTEE
jgi:sigma-B regulation protein RsbU (phosphoserine phosphatase)